MYNSDLVGPTGSVTKEDEIACCEVVSGDHSGLTVLSVKRPRYGYLIEPQDLMNKTGAIEPLDGCRTRPQVGCSQKTYCDLHRLFRLSRPVRYRNSPVT